MYSNVVTYQQAATTEEPGKVAVGDPLGDAAKEATNGTAKDAPAPETATAAGPPPPP